MDSAVAAWLGGLATWVTTFAFDYREHRTQFQMNKKEVETRKRYDPKFKVDGDIDEYVANNYGKATWGDSISRTYAEPLFVSTIVGWTAISGSEYIRWVLGLQLLVTLVLVGATTGVGSPSWLRRWWFIVPAWFSVLVVLWLCSWFAQGGAGPGNPLASITTPSGTTMVLGILAALVVGVLIGRWWARSTPSVERGAVQPRR